MNAIFRRVVIIVIIGFLVTTTLPPVWALEDRMDGQRDANKDDEHFSEESYSHFVQEGYDENHRCRYPVPEAFTAVANLNIDNTLIEATPHWFLLAVGKAEQKALLNYIKQADVSKNKKTAWTRFMKKVWMKYPVKYVKTDNSAKLVPGKPITKFSPTSKENEIFREIEFYIAEDMEKVSANEQTENSGLIMPQWQSPEHSSFSSIACKKEAIPEALTKLMSDAAPVPDTIVYPGGWAEFSINHGFVPAIPLPGGVGLAPTNCGNFASKAKTYFQSHQYDTAFTYLGYSSHFMEDVGNPFHTPPAFIIALQFVDDISYFRYTTTGEIMNYKVLHDNYETFVDTFWSSPLPSGIKFSSIADSVTNPVIVTDPVLSAQKLAVESAQTNPKLVWAVYLYFTNTRKFDFQNNPVIVTYTMNSVFQTERYTRGLVQYLTNGQLIKVSITPSAGAHGKVTPSEKVTLEPGAGVTFTITPDPEYIVDQVLVDGDPKGPITSYPFTNVLSDHTITATFKPASSPEGIIPLCQAGAPFDLTKYPQNTLYSDPMEFKCSWDGTGRVFISGDKSSLTGVYADDGFTITLQPAGASFDAQPHSACQHKILELTSGMTPGLNTFTLIVQNWRRLSMSYGSSTGYGTDQTPYIVQVNYPTDTALTSQAPIEQMPFVENESEKEG